MQMRRRSDASRDAPLRTERVVSTKRVRPPSGVGRPAKSHDARRLRPDALAVDVSKTVTRSRRPNRDVLRNEAADMVAVKK